MKKILMIIFLFLVLIPFCYTKIYSQEEKNDTFQIDFSVDITHYRGKLGDIDCEIYPSVGIRIFKIKSFELHTKIGPGVWMIPHLERELLSAKINLETFIGRKKHFLVSGIEYLRVGRHGEYFPIFIGYRYSLSRNHSVVALYKPLLWSSYYVWDGYGVTERMTHWMWEKYSYTGYAIQISYYFHF